VMLVLPKRSATEREQGLGVAAAIDLAAAAVAATRLRSAV